MMLRAGPPCVRASAAPNRAPTPLGPSGVHMYTLNLERSAMAILEGVGLIDPANVPRPLPWRHIPSSGQRAEEVRHLHVNNCYFFRVNNFLIV
jgi:hypothetical protein